MPGPSLNKIPTQRRVQTGKRRQPSPRSTYGNNALSKPTVSRPGASVGGRQRVRTTTTRNLPTRTTRNLPTRTSQRKPVQRKTIGGTKYPNYGISDRNPMND